MISLINSGLNDLYGRFVIREKELIVKIIEGRTRYPLTSNHAESQCKPNPCDEVFILDRASRFCDDINQVLRVLRVGGDELPLNNDDEPMSVFTPSPTLLQVPVGCPWDYLSVIYKARHPKLEMGVLNAPVHLPDALYDALYSFIGWKVYQSMNGQDNQMNAAGHKSAFDEACALVTANDLLSETKSNTGSKFNMRGFV